MGVDFIDFITFESNSIVLREYDISMDIQLYLKQNRLDFIADSTINKVGTENNVDPYPQTNYFADNSEGPMGGFEELPSPVSLKYNFVARTLEEVTNGLETRKVIVR